MKLTWFGGRTLRIHMGGRIVVWRPAPIAGVAEEELVSGADRVVTGGAGLARLDGASWRPRRTASALDETERRAEMQVAEFGEDVGLIEIPGEPPLLVAGAPSPRLGRWARDAVVVAFSSIAAASMLEAAGPRLIALALPEAELDAAFASLRGGLGDTALIALEPGLAIEV